MNNGNSDAVFEDETWGGENSSMGLTDCSDETDQSDFTPGELALMRRKRSTKTAPLPKGVDDVKWQPPVATGLDNSTAIFQTKDDGRGMLTLSSEGISENNNHFRRWQEDNGIAKSFASRTVEKEVDGKRITVAVAKKPSTLANRLVRANTGAATTTRRPSSAGAVLQAVPIPSSSPVPDVQYLRSLSKRLPVEECGSLMNSGDNNAVFEDETCETGDAGMRLTNCSEATDESDFTPSELAMMKRKGSTKTAPLPKGVDDVKWQPPVATGLNNSAAIFQAKADERGMLTIPSEGISESNNHFRSWQEDNGVARTFGSRTVEKDVDGKRITVAIAKKPASFAKRLVRANTGGATTKMRPSSAGAVVQPAAILSEESVPDVEHLRSFSKRLSLEKCSDKPA
eukprot:g1956.t1